jgi:signal peptidase I
MESVKRVFLSLAVALCGFFVLQPYRPVIVQGRSMTPTFDDKQLVVSGPLNRAVRAGDIVLLEKDGTTLVKRVAMVPGDRYTELYVKYAHRWVMVKTRAQRRMVEKGMKSRVRTVPEGLVYVLGDNPELSLDSRNFGMVPLESVRGLVYQLS